MNDVREGIKDFSSLLLSADPKTQFSLVEFGGAAITVMDFTSDQAKIEASLGKLVSKPSESVLNEGLVDVAKRLAALPTDSRTVIITINLEPTRDATNVQAPSRCPPDHRGQHVRAARCNRGRLQRSGFLCSSSCVIPP